MEFVFVVPRQDLFLDCTPHGLQLFQNSNPTDPSSQPGSYAPGMQGNGQGTRDSERNELQSEAELEFQNIVERCGFFVEREYAERTPALKQVIPYTIVFRRDDLGSPQVFRLMRTKAGGEARLHNKLSIGVGGHIEPIDLAPSSPLQTEARGNQAPVGHVPTAQESPEAQSPPGTPLRNPIPGATRREVLEEELEVSGPWQLRAVGLINDDTNPVGAVHVGLVQLLEVSGDVSVRETEQLTGHFAPLSELLSELEAGANYETWSSLILPHLGELMTDEGSSYSSPRSLTSDPIRSAPGASSTGSRANRTVLNP